MFENLINDFSDNDILLTDAGERFNLSHLNELETFDP